MIQWFLVYAILTCNRFCLDHDALKLEVEELEREIAALEAEPVSKVNEVFHSTII